MKAFLLDTDTCIYALKQKRTFPTPHASWR
jgi:hypothetical protein